MKTILFITTISAIFLQGCASAMYYTDERIQQYTTGKICHESHSRKEILNNPPALITQNTKNKITAIHIKSMNELRRRKAFSEKEIDLISRGAVRIGMSKEALLCSAGRPQDINRSIGSYGTHEQWVYGTPLICSGIGCIGGTSGYIYIENGRVSGWQD